MTTSHLLWFKSFDSKFLNKNGDEFLQGHILEFSRSGNAYITKIFPFRVSRVYCSVGLYRVFQITNLP